MSLRDEFLRVPVSPRLGEIPEGAMTQRVEFSGDTGAVEVKGGADMDFDAAAAAALASEGLDPEEWQATGFRSSRWTMANGEEGVSKRFTFARKTLSQAAVAPLGVDELLAEISGHNLPARPSAPPGLPAEIIPIGDMQFGKTDMEDWTEQDALGNALKLIDQTAKRLEDDWLARTAARLSAAPYRDVAIVWLGDHVEGFVSQNGSNAWRTKLTLTEQIRLTRRVMMYAIEKIAPRAGRLICVAVPGNHGETIRFQGKGITRYDDSHDTEALISVAEACALSGAYKHVEFLVPDNDELTVAFEIGGTKILVAHGHQIKAGKHFEWWEKQAFHGNAGADATVLLAGHLHHLFIESSGKRFFAQFPAFESGSQWYRLLTGTRPHPGLVSLRVLDGNVVDIHGLWGGGQS